MYLFPPTPAFYPLSRPPLRQPVFVYTCRWQLCVCLWKLGGVGHDPPRSVNCRLSGAREQQCNLMGICV